MGIASSKLFREHISCFSSFAAADAACSPVFWSGCAEESSWTPISEIGRKMQLHRRHTKKVREVMEGEPLGEGTLYAICRMLYVVCDMRMRDGSNLLAPTSACLSLRLPVLRLVCHRVSAVQTASTHPPIAPFLGTGSSENAPA